MKNTVCAGQFWWSRKDEQIWSSGRPEGSDAEERQEIVVVCERQKNSDRVEGRKGKITKTPVAKIVGRE